MISESCRFPLRRAHARARHARGVPCDSLVLNDGTTTIATVWLRKGFFYLQTPLITSSDCEGAGEMFRVTTMPETIGELPRIKGEASPAPVAAPAAAPVVDAALVSELEALVAAKGDELRDLKATTKDKAVLQPTIDELLALKAKLEAATAGAAPAADAALVSALEAQVAAKGDELRELKARVKDKAVLQPTIDELLALKAELELAAAP